MGNDFEGNVIVESATTNVFGHGVAFGAQIKLNYSTKINGGPQVGQTVVGATSHATGVVVPGGLKDNGGANTGTIYLGSITGTFQTGELLQVASVTVCTTTSVPLLTQLDGPVQFALCYRESVSPNGVLAAPQGSLCVVGQAATLFINTDGATAWTGITIP